MTRAAVKLRDYFAAVEKRLFCENRKFYTLQARIQNKLLNFHFQTQEQEEQARLSLTGLVVDNPGPGDADFYHWVDELEAYLPTEAAGRAGVWTCRDDTGYLNVTTQYGMTGVDYGKNRYYYCLQDAVDSKSALNSHALIACLFRWALQTDLLVLHSAAVGIGGNGVLIGARGGRGKSTLAVACLLQGLDFTSDDYVLLNQKGPLTAMPLYRTVGLNPDSAAILKPALPVLKRDPQRGGKLLLDASGERICEELPIRGIVFPKIGPHDKPEIIPVAPGQALTQMVHSSLVQFDVLREISLVRLMLERLQGLPVYEIRLTKDPAANVRCLRGFLQSHEWN